MSTSEDEIREAILPIKEMKLAGYDILHGEELKKEAAWIHPATVAWARKLGMKRHPGNRNLFLYYFQAGNYYPHRCMFLEYGWYVGDPLQPKSLDDAINTIRDWFEDET